MGYFDHISKTENGGVSSSYSLDSYFDNYKFKLLDEWLEEDRREILSEAETIDPHWADTWFSNVPSSIWNTMKGWVTGTDPQGKAIANSKLGNIIDRAVNNGAPDIGYVGGKSRGIAGIIKSWFGGNVTDEKGNDTGKLATEGFKGMANQLSDFMRNNSNVTTAGLAAAGLLGIYYLYRKWKNNKNSKPTVQNLKTAAELDQKDPSQLPPSEKNRPVEA